jgi:hypothetical protein
MRVARKAQFERQRSDVFGVRQLDQSATQAQATLVAGNRDALVSAELIGEVCGRDVKLCSDAGE